MAALGNTLVERLTVDIIIQVAQCVNRPEVGAERCLGPMTKVPRRGRGICLTPARHVMNNSSIAWVKGPASSALHVVRAPDDCVPIATIAHSSARLLL